MQNSLTDLTEMEKKKEGNPSFLFFFCPLHISRKCTNQTSTDFGNENQRAKAEFNCLELSLL